MAADEDSSEDERAGPSKGKEQSKGASSKRQLPADPGLPGWQILEHKNGSGRKWKTFHGPHGEVTKSRVTAPSSGGGGKAKAAGGGGGSGGGGGGGGGGARATSA